MAVARPLDVVEAPPPPPGWLATALEFCRQRPLRAVGAAIILVMFLVAVTSAVLAPYDPQAVDFGGMLAAPSAAHWLGTDAFGRDVLSRLIYGSRTALIVGFVSSFLGATLGAVLGVGSAYFGGRIDLYLQRLMDIFISFPLIILALALVAILGNAIPNLILAIMIPMIPRSALVIRSSALAIREMPYVDAARAGDREAVALDQSRRKANAHHALEHQAQQIALAKAAMTVLREGRMIRDRVVQIEPAEPPIGQV